MLHGRQRNLIYYFIITVIAITILALILSKILKRDPEVIVVTVPSEEATRKKAEAELMMQILSGIAVQTRSVESGGHIAEDYNLTQTPANATLPSCALYPKGLKGPYKVDRTPHNWSEIEEKYPWLEDGGHGRPAECLAQHRVAIIVPYRNREDHLKLFVNNLHDFLRPQELDYSIVIVEQIPHQTFNRAKLMNVGYAEALKAYPWECFVFHDVDMLPEDDRTLYSCPVLPRHLSVSIDIFNYTLLHEGNFGGVVSLTKDQIEEVNGFPNDYWGWGGEDDDLLVRVHEAGYNYTRYPGEIARYTMHKHKHAGDEGNQENECKWRLFLDAQNRWKVNGLNNLKYKVEKTKFNKLYMHVLVDLLEEESKGDIPARLNCTQ